MTISPKLKRNISRIIPFGVIWLVISWVYALTDISSTKNQNLNPETDITLTLPVFLFANFALLVLGLTVGFIEMVILERRLTHLSLSRKIAAKLLLYLSLMLTVISITYPIAASIESQTAITNPEIRRKMLRFFGSLTFLDTLVQLTFSILISIIYASTSEHLGHQALLNLITGKYHKPRIEHRIFMFLDMKESTTIAERLGHVQYFQFLQAYYQTMSDAIIDAFGEVYQYIGDEVVITWTAKKGFKNNNCIQCFDGIKHSLNQKASAFEKRYGVVPDFKAGLHVGEVTSGEIGAMKKEIVYSGDVLNTAARIQGLCSAQQADLILSEQVLNGLSDPSSIKTKPLGEFQLKGKEAPVTLFAFKGRSA